MRCVCLCADWYNEVTVIQTVNIGNAMLIQ